MGLIRIGVKGSRICLKRTEGRMGESEGGRERLEGEETTRGSERKE